MLSDLVEGLLKSTGGDPAADAQILEDIKDVEHTVEWHSLTGEDGIERRIRRIRIGSVDPDAPLTCCTLDEFNRDLADAAARAK